MTKPPTQIEMAPGATVELEPGEYEVTLVGADGTVLTRIGGIVAVASISTYTAPTYFTSPRDIAPSTDDWTWSSM